MYIEQLYTSCLAEAAYYIESDGEAAIIDPLRETAPYIRLAEARGSKIKYVFETHFHADFVSGHIDLAKKTGASIVYGPTAETGYHSLVAKDEEVFRIGKITIQVLHTPGHTLESSCYLLKDEAGKPHAVFTGDTLFVGDVGRPDLAIKSDLTIEDLAGMLFESLNKKIKTLSDEVIVYPGHGAGSACGKSIGKETYSTIGQQKKNNYALQDLSRDSFIKAVTDGLTAPPGYFAHDASLNKKGYTSIDDVMAKNTNALSVQEFEKLCGEGLTILDTRNPEEFEKAFVPGSVNIGLNGQYAPWVGALLDPSKPLLLVAAEGTEEESVLRLARVGYENVKGYLRGGIALWMAEGKKTGSIKSIDAQGFAAGYKNVEVIDVRNPGEWNTGVVENAQLISLADLEKKISMLSKSASYYIHCAGGYRSMMAASIMKKNGFGNVVNVSGGMSRIRETGIPLVQPVNA